MATTMVALVWLSPAVRVVFGPVELEHIEVAPPPCEVPGERLAGTPPQEGGEPSAAQQG